MKYVSEESSDEIGIVNVTVTMYALGERSDEKIGIVGVTVTMYAATATMVVVDATVFCVSFLVFQLGFDMLSMHRPVMIQKDCLESHVFAR